MLLFSLYKAINDESTIMSNVCNHFYNAQLHLSYSMYPTTGAYYLHLYPLPPPQSENHFIEKTNDTTVHFEVFKIVNLFKTVGFLKNRHKLL